jgi:heme exporter protein D
MTVSNYAVAAYAVFALALGWDYFAPRLRLRRVLRDIAARARREAARKATA